MGRGQRQLQEGGSGDGVLGESLIVHRCSSSTNDSLPYINSSALGRGVAALRTRRLRDVGRLVVYLCSAKIIKVIKDTDLRPCVQRKNPTVTRRVCYRTLLMHNMAQK